MNDNRTGGGTTISLSEIVAALGQRWRLIAICAGAGLVLAILYLHLATYTYTAELDVVPAQPSENRGGASLGRLGDLASSLAGVDIGGGGGDAQFELYVEAIQSRSAADAMARRPDIMRGAFEDRWDEKAGAWKQPGLLRQVRNAVSAVLGIPPAADGPPDGAALQEYMARNITVDQNPKKMLVAITFQHRDPAFAIRFLRELNSTIDAELRRKQLQRATEYISYISRKLDTVTVSEYREALTQALIEQEKRRMMASSNLPFTADTFGPPGVPARPSNPRPVFVLLLSVVAGALLGAFLALASALDLVGNWPWRRRRTFHA